jgi:hypothetical protein
MPNGRSRRHADLRRAGRTAHRRLPPTRPFVTPPRPPARAPSPYRLSRRRSGPHAACARVPRSACAPLRSRARTARTHATPWARSDARGPKRGQIARSAAADLSRTHVSRETSTLPLDSRAEAPTGLSSAPRRAMPSHGLSRRCLRELTCPAWRLLPDRPKCRADWLSRRARGDLARGRTGPGTPATLLHPVATTRTAITGQTPSRTRAVAARPRGDPPVRADGGR